MWWCDLEGDERKGKEGGERVILGRESGVVFSRVGKRERVIDGWEDWGGTLGEKEAGGRVLGRGGGGFPRIHSV